jgi:hypothetical protein
VRILATQDRGPGWGAAGSRREALLESQALVNQERLHRRHRTEVVSAEIVGHDQDQVWPHRGLIGALFV